jgi:tetratricopeptide (TPR) repeat protein
MRADRTNRRAARRNANRPAALAALGAALLIALAAAPSVADDPPTSAQAIERARALEEDGFVEEAEIYLRELVDTERSLARDAEVLIELARLTGDPDEAAALASRAIERTRDARIIVAAHALRGDVLYASGLYVAAAEEYGAAARHGSTPGAREAALGRAASLLAAGDATTAIEEYGEVAEEGATPDELTPLAKLGMGRALLAAGRPAEAAAEFDHVAETYADDDVRIRALAGAAESHEAAGAPVVALRALEMLASEFPNTLEGVLARERAGTLSAELAAPQAETEEP